MFSVPTDPLSTDQFEPIFIDEKADVLALLLHNSQRNRCWDDLVPLKADVTILHAAVMATDKFDVDDPQDELDDALDYALDQTPFRIFATASRQNNLHLGKMAIKNMTHSRHRVGKFDFWQEVSEATPSWQVALARLLLPKPTLWKTDNGEDNDVTALSQIDMDQVAENFSPK